MTFFSKLISAHCGAKPQNAMARPFSYFSVNTAHKLLSAVSIVLQTMQLQEDNRGQVFCGCFTLFLGYHSPG